MLAVSKKVGNAISEYHMLQDKDKIIIAVSGGKDSLCLLKLMLYRLTFIPIQVDVLAVHIDLGMPDFNVEEMSTYFEELGVKYHIESAPLLKDHQRWEDINCFWCAWNRRKMLFELCERLDYNKIAFGHHMDDIIETTLLNMFYQGEISTMKPTQSLFDGKVNIIRPLAYVEEKYLIEMAVIEQIKNFDHFQCPNNDVSKRKKIKDMIADLSDDNNGVKKNIFRSLQRVKEEYLLDVNKKSNSLKEGDA